MEQKAAQLIFTRLYEIGFPGGFVVQPEDFTDDEAKQVRRYVLDAMSDVVELRSLHKQGTIILRKGRHLVLGIVTFLRDLAKDGWQAKDLGERLVYGFFGYVWKIEDGIRLEGFPELDQFSEMMETWIRPHWKEYETGEWAVMPHLSHYEVQVRLSAFRVGQGKPTLSAEPFRGKTVLLPSQKEEELVLWGISKAQEMDDFSLHTSAVIYSSRDFTSCFQYVSQLAMSVKSEEAPARTEEREEEKPFGVDLPSEPEGSPDSGTYSTGKNFFMGAAAAVLVLLLVVVLLVGHIHKTVIFILAIICLFIAAACFYKGARIGRREEPWKEELWKEEPQKEKPQKVEPQKEMLQKETVSVKLETPPMEKPQVSVPQPPAKRVAGENAGRPKKETTDDIFRL